MLLRELDEKDKQRGTKHTEIETSVDKVSKKINLLLLIQEKESTEAEAKAAKAEM